MVKFYNKVKIANYKESHFSPFHKKLLRNRVKSDVCFSSFFEEKFRAASLFDVVSLYRICKHKVSERMKQSIYSNNSVKGGNKSLFGASKKKYIKKINNSFSKSLCSVNKSLMDDYNSASKKKLIELISRNLNKLESNIRKNSKNQMQILNRFKPTKTEKFKLEDYVFKIMDSVMVNLYLRVSVLNKRDQCQFLGIFD
jgi:hypothetical protein